jgi:hypothetical protein
MEVSDSRTVSVSNLPMSNITKEQTNKVDLIVPIDKIYHHLRSSQLLDPEVVWATNVDETFSPN